MKKQYWSPLVLAALAAALAYPVSGFAFRDRPPHPPFGGEGPGAPDGTPMRPPIQSCRSASRDAARMCAETMCADASQAARTACSTDPRSSDCQSAREALQTCLQPCFAQLRADVQSCSDALKSCVQACIAANAPTPTPTP